MLKTSINESDPLKINAPVEPVHTTAKILLENNEEVICIDANPAQWAAISGRRFDPIS
jgi:hypothetical protein